MENHRIGYRSYWVAYFDMLGFENRVKVMPAVYPILEAYRTALNEIRQNPEEIRCKWFSDTFLFYTPDDSEKSCAGIMQACEFFFYRMIRSRIPVRGCLAIGDFYEDASDGVVVGPTLIDAYKLAESQDWLGFVLSREATKRRDEYGIRRDHYREYDVPVNHSPEKKKLEVFVLSHRFRQCCSPDEWWRCLDEMEGNASVYISAEKGSGKERQRCDTPPPETERDRILRKYRNSKEFLRSLYPQLGDFVQGEYGSIPLNRPEIRRRIRELSWRLT